jgi:hypothetical protein
MRVVDGEEPSFDPDCPLIEQVAERQNPVLSHVRCDELRKIGPRGHEFQPFARFGLDVGRRRQ